MTRIRAESSAKSHPYQEMGNRTIALSPCMALRPSSSARPTTAKGDRLLQACRDILDGPDTAGRRCLTRQLRGNVAPHGAMSLGASLPLLGLERIRDRLRFESPGVVCGRDGIRHEPASKVSCMEIIA